LFLVDQHRDHNHEYIHAYCDTTVIRSPRVLIRY
jgi:hypothetical protein